MKNPLIFILDENNDYLRYGGTVKALNGYNDRVVVITPQPISATTFISVSMLPKNRNDNRYEQYLSPTSKKPSDYIDNDDALSQTTLTWNVYEQDIKQDALLEFSQFSSGNISFAFAIQQISPSSKCVTYQGVFGVDNPLPSSGQTIGDYYECEDIDYSIESGTHTYAFSRGMLVYWNGSRWVKDRLKTLGGATAVDIPVEPNHAVGYELEDDETLAVEATIAQVVINEQDIEDLKQKDSDILSGAEPFDEITLKDALNNQTSITYASKVALDNEVARLETDKADKTYVDSQDTILDNKINTLDLDLQGQIDSNDGDITNLQNNKVPKTTTIIGLDLQDNILIGEFRTALGNATQSVAGLLSPEDKTHYDVLVALLEDSDGNNVVDTIGEILAIFQNYPEGVDILTALGDKVDKVLTSYDALTSEAVVGTELVYVDAGGTAKKMTLTELFEATNNSSGAFVPNGVYDNLTVGYAKKSEDGVDIDDKFASIDDEKVDKEAGKGLSTEDYTTTEKNKLSGIEAGAEVNVQSDWTQEVNTADDYIKNKPAIPTKISDLTNDAGYITGYTETDPIFTAWDKSTGISITKSQVSDLIEATQALSGLMSATDKQRLDVLHALLEEDTENNVVDSINEVLAIFNNYPEGADLVSALAGKVNKVDIVDNLTTNDATKVLSAKQGKVLNDAVALKVNTSDIVDNLTSTDTNKPLSANQGKVLKDLIDTTVGNIDDILDSILGV